MYYTTLLKDIYICINVCVYVCVCIGKHEDRIITLAGAWPSGRFLPPEKEKRKPTDSDWLWMPSAILYIFLSPQHFLILCVYLRRRRRLGHDIVFNPKAPLPPFGECFLARVDKRERSLSSFAITASILLLVSLSEYFSSLVTNFRYIKKGE